MRETANGHPFRLSDRSALEVGPEERMALYEAAWARGGLQFRATFRDLLSDLAANETAASFIKAKIRQIVKNPATAELLADIDHPYAAKRPPIDTDYFETFNRDNVRLVDVRAAPIDRITPAGIRTTEAEYPLDIIVFATGLRCHDRAAAAARPARARRRVAREAWAAGPAAISASASRASRTSSPSPAGQPLRALQHARADRAAVEDH
jgi:cation diffusion facilitator CzcD-associated flavoprotein CzcO